MRKDKSKLVVLTAGGTGGHVYPADALASELEKRGYEPVLFTDSRGLKNYKGKLSEIGNRAILSGSVVGKSPLTKVLSLAKVGLGVMQAAWYLLLQRPRCVVGFGGYASFPTAVAAILLRIPLILHEQNSVMSRTNRLLARFALVVAQSFDNAKYTPAKVKTFLSGMPVRPAIAALYKEKYQAPKADEKMTVIVLGGSQGASVFAETMPKAAKSLSPEEQKKTVIYQQCRKGEEEKVAALYEGFGGEVTVRAFFDNMPELYRQAKMIVSRAGASSVYEIAAVGLPAVLVPLPTAADNHQYFNALTLAEKKACVLVEQADFSPEKVVEIWHDFRARPEYMQQISEAAKRAAIVDAASRLADRVETSNLE
jgi:UDP-N-acetylglucosamine--N-acetylmuramyl-(pentapeptide) pyrophosphoryl-undecaprenol N-acetylglucosamine transferase